MEVNGKSLWQQVRIDELVSRLGAAEALLNAKLYKHVYDGKIAILESNDARHNADIAHLESNTVLKATHNETIERLSNKDAIHDVRINTLEALKNTKKDLVEYTNDMTRVDAIDTDHLDRILALEAQVLTFEAEIANIINVRLGEKIDKVAVAAIKEHLEDIDSAFAVTLSGLVSSQVQTAIDAAQTLKIDGKVDDATFVSKVGELTGNNRTWEQRLNAVDQYILAMLETYQINISGNQYVYDAKYKTNLDIEKKHFKIVGRRIPGTVVVELQPFAYNTFYGKMTLHLKGTTTLPVATVTKPNVNESTYRVNLNINAVISEDSFPLVVTMYDTAGVVIQQDVSLTQTAFQDQFLTPILSAPLFKYANANIKLVAKPTGSLWEHQYSFAPEAVSGSSMSGITWRCTQLLPTGLEFNPANGVISGVPTATGNYQVNVFAKYTNNGNDENGVQLNFEVISVPTISYSGVLPSYKRNDTIITELSPAVTSIVTSYGILPALPTGMSFSTATGKISGTPLVTSPLTTYTVTAFGIVTGGDGTTSFQFAVVETAPVITYEFSAVAPKNKVSLPVNVLMPETMPNIGELSGPIFITNGFAISPELPFGLNLDANTGKISGTPTAPYIEATHTITATGAGGSGTASIVLSVKADIPVFSYNANNEYRQYDTIQDLEPVAGVDSGAVDMINGYALYNLAGTTPVTLPTGLNFNVNTGVISDTPIVALATTGYSVVATGPGGASSPMPFYITVKAAVPVIAYASAENVATRGVAITPFGPISPTNSPTYYSIVPLLPIGLSFDNDTGFVSGTSRVVSDPAVEYTVVAYNAGGESVSKTFTLKVVEPAPEIAYSVTTVTLTANGLITPIVPSLSKNRIDSWSMSPGHPQGLEIDVDGVISGAPAMRNNEAVDVIVTATGNGSDSFTISMRVKESAPTFSYPAGTRDLNLLVNGSIDPVPGNNHAIDGWSLSTGTLPEGLTLNSETGVISGPPTAVGGPVTVTVIANGKDFPSLAMPVIIDVNDGVPPTGYKVDGQLDAGAGFEVKVWSNSASNEDIVFVKKTSEGSVTANLAFTNDLTASVGDLSVYTAIGQAVTFANSDYYRFVINRATQHGARLAVIQNLGDMDNDVLLARFLIDPKYEVFIAPVIGIASDADLAYETNEAISIGIVNTGGPVINYSLISGSGLTFNVANNTLGGSIATAGSYPFTFKAIGKGGDSNEVTVTVVVSAPVAPVYSSPEIITSGPPSDTNIRFTPNITLTTGTYWGLQVSTDGDVWGNAAAIGHINITQGVEVSVNRDFSVLSNYTLIRAVYGWPEQVIAGPSPLTFT
jgi:hypothetical protein